MGAVFDWRLCRRVIGANLLALSLLTFFGVPGSAVASPEIVDLRAAIHGGNLVCHLRTAGIPGAETRGSLQDGLPARIDFRLRLLNRSNVPILRRKFSFSLAFDLWEEVFRVERSGNASRLSSIDDVQEYFGEIRGIGLMPAAALEPGRKYRLSIEIEEFPIAPATKERIGQWIAGDEEGIGGNPDEREVSFGIGELIRFFYRSPRRGMSEGVSGEGEWFTLEELQMEGRLP